MDLQSSLLQPSHIVITGGCLAAESLVALVLCTNYCIIIIILILIIYYLIYYYFLTLGRYIPEGFKKLKKVR